MPSTDRHERRGSEPLRPHVDATQHDIEGRHGYNACCDGDETQSQLPQPEERPHEIVIEREQQRPRIGPA